MRRWTLGKRVAALCTAVGVLLGVIAITATATAAANREQVARVVDRIGPAHNNAERLLSAVLRQQAGIRAYAASGRAEDMANYQAGLQSEIDLARATGALLRDEPALLTRLREVQAGIAMWRTEVAEPLLAQVMANGPNLALATQDDAARARFEQVVDLIGVFQRETGQAHVEAARGAKNTGNALVALLIAAAAVVLVAGFVLAVLLRQLVTRPVTDLAADVRRVARGEYELELASAGPPEVSRLARDINAMRQQIVADLATVRQARELLEDANRRLEQQAEELSRSNRDLEQFAYVASHDLQEPLRKVSSFCQLLQRRYAGHLDDRADQYIAFAVDGAQRMQRLINDLLAFSRIGRITTGFGEVDLDRVVTEAAAQLDARRGAGRITWSDLPTVRGEEPLLLALFTNLIGNSLKFRQPDRPPRVHISAERVGGVWQLSCRDNGIGVEADFAEKIFVIFQRLHPRDQYPGTGIGLAIAKKIVEYHGGQIWLDTEPAEGTVIRFTLPVIAADDDQPGSATPLAAPELAIDALLAGDGAPLGDGQGVGDPEPARSAEPARNTEPARNPEPAHNTEPARSPEPARNAEPAHSGGPASGAEPDVGAVPTNAAVRKAEPARNAGPAPAAQAATAAPTAPEETGS